ncbi:MAG: nucleotidyltransferase family protein [Polyangia bacterium]
MLSSPSMTLPNPQHVILFHHFRRLLERAAEERIDVAPLKGAHLVTSVYPPEEDRGPMADVDFLVREEDWTRALEICRELGFRPRFGTLDEGQIHEVGFKVELSGGKEVLIEAHRWLVDPRRFSLDHEALWARSRSSTFDGAPCRRLANEDQLCFVAFHELLHRLGNPSRALRDVELLLKDEKTDPELVVARAGEWRVRRAVWLMLDLLAKKKRDEQSAATAERLAPPLPIRAAIEALLRDGTVSRWRRLSYRAQAALLWPLLFDAPHLTARFVAFHPKALGRMWRL